jgi:uncharacterized protein (DUF1697 family)
MKMKTYISILRGINVGGNRLIKMADLREQDLRLGWVDCQTFIQSGNVIFRGGITDTQELATTLERMIAEQFHFEVPVLVMELEELRKIVAANPFLHDSGKALLHQHVTFLSGRPDKELFGKLGKTDYLPTEFELIDKSVYLYCPDGYSNSKLTNGFLESRLKVRATTRNWKTTCEILLIAEKTDQL